LNVEMGFVLAVLVLALAVSCEGVGAVTDEFFPSTPEDVEAKGELALRSEMLGRRQGLALRGREGRGQERRKKKGEKKDLTVRPGSPRGGS
jgi:hypothetical protein